MPTPVAPKQGTTPSGAPALLDSQGRVYMRDTAGNLQRVPADLIGKQLREHQWDLASEADFQAAAGAVAGEDAPGTAFLESFAAGIPEAGLALPRAAQQLAGVATAETASALGLADEEKVEKVKAKVMAGETLPFPFSIPTGREVVAGIKHPLDAEAREAYKQRAAKRAADSPIASTVGTLGGEIVGSGGFLAPQGVAPRLVYGAVAGASGGVSGVTEDAFVRNTPLTAEHLVAGVGLGAAFGVGVEGAFIGGAKALERTVGGKFGSGLTAAQQVAIDTRFRHMGLSKSDVYQLASSPELRDRLAWDIIQASDVHVKPAWFREVADETGAVARQFVPEGTPGAKATYALAEAGEKGAERVYGRGVQEMAYRASRALDASVDQLADLYRAADQTIASNTALKATVQETVENSFRRIANEVIAPLASDTASLAANPKLKGLTAQIRKMQDVMGPEPTIERFAKVMRDVGHDAYTRGGHPAVQMIQDELGAIERIMKDDLAAVMEKLAAAPRAPGQSAVVGEKVFGKYVQLRRQTAALERIMGYAQKTSAGEIVRTPGLSPYMMGVTGGVRGPAQAIEAGLLSETARLALKEINYRAGAVAYWAAKKTERDTRKGLLAAFGRRKPLRYVGAGEFAKGFGSPEEAYRHRAGQIAEATTNPGALAERLGTAMAPSQAATPKLNGMIAMSMARALGFLASKLPPGGITVNPLDPRHPKVTATAEEIRRFALYWETVNDPRTALAALSRNRLTPEHVEALKAVYPLLFQDIQRQALEILADGKHQFTYDQRAQFDLLLELHGAGEPSLAPTFQATLQQARTAVEAEIMASTPKRGAAPKSADKSSNRYRTLSDSSAAQG